MANTTCSCGRFIGASQPIYHTHCCDLCKKSKGQQHTKTCDSRSHKLVFGISKLAYRRLRALKARLAECELMMRCCAPEYRDAVANKNAVRQAPWLRQQIEKLETAHG